MPARASQTQLAARQSGRITRLSFADFLPLQQRGAALIYDVRPSFFYSLGHIPGALSWPKTNFEAQLGSREQEIQAATASSKPVVLYCTDQACPDAQHVAEGLAQRGHDVAILEGGYAAWKLVFP